MRHHRTRQNRRTGFRFNMTPLIDCTFLLLTFFMLTSHFASAEKVEMDLPRPDDSQAVERQPQEKVILNLSYAGPGMIPSLRMGPVDLASLADLEVRLAELARQNPQMEVILRADRRVPYGQVRQVMQTVASQKLTRLQVVAELEQTR